MALCEAGCPLIGQVILGNEVLEDRGFRELRGKRVGLITNPSGVTRDGRTTIELMRRAPGVRLVALFGPEHGVHGDVPAGGKVAAPSCALGASSDTSIPNRSV